MTIDDKYLDVLMIALRRLRHDIGKNHALSRTVTEAQEIFSEYVKEHSGPIDFTEINKTLTARGYGPASEDDDGNITIPGFNA